MHRYNPSSFRSALSRTNQNRSYLFARRLSTPSSSSPSLYIHAWRRFASSSPPRTPFWQSKRENIKRMEMGDIVLYCLSLWISFFGFAYASAPLYRSLCQTFGWGGTINRKVDGKLKSLTKWRESSDHQRKNRKLLIRFDTRTGSGMEWDFEPVQSYVITRCGESTLAFFKASNMSEKPMSGLSTYTVLPYKAAPYFIKIQCFCFEEQRLRGNETVDMPVLFFVEPDFLDDPTMKDVEEITLSYIFYPVVDESGEVEEDDFENDPFYNEGLEKATLPRSVDSEGGDTAAVSTPSLEPQLQA